MELERRVIACKGWRWMDGMLSMDTGLRLDDQTEDWEADYPNLSDPATLGCLLYLVRRAWGDDTLSTVCPEPGVWFIAGAPDNPTGPVGDTEAEALVLALEEVQQ